MTELVNLGAEMDLARDERCEGVKKRMLYQDTSTRVNFYVTYVIIGVDLECAVNNENM